MRLAFRFSAVLSLVCGLVAAPRAGLGAPEEMARVERGTGVILVSETRACGPRGARDSFVELFNSGSQPLSLSGWTLRFRNEVGEFVRVALPEKARVAARGHYLLTGRDYSLGRVAAGDFAFDATISSGVQLCDASGKISDAIGPNRSEPTLREGAGLPDFLFATPEIPAPTQSAPTQSVPTQSAPLPQFSWVRLAPDGAPQDGDDNARDFRIVSVAGEFAGFKAQIGAPGPEDSRSPILRPFIAKKAAENTGETAANPQIGAPQNIALQSDAARNSMRRARRDIGPNRAQGTMTLRYRFKNETGRAIKNLWFRVGAITSEPDADDAPARSADVRLIRWPTPKIAAPNAPKIAIQNAPKTARETLSQRALTVWKAQLSSAPNQPLGGGLNALLTVELPPQGIPAGGRGEIWFSLGVERSGNYRVVLGNERQNIVFEGNTELDDLALADLLRSDLSRAATRRETTANSRGGTIAGIQNQKRGGAAAQVGNAAAIAAARAAMGQGAPASGGVLEGNTEEGVTAPVRPSAKDS